LDGPCDALWQANAFIELMKGSTQNIFNSLELP